jgi:hypothetical protein
VIGRDGALQVADTENRHIRRIDLASGVITTFGGDVGITVSLAAGPDGSIYSADVVRAGSPGESPGRRPPESGRASSPHPAANGVAIAPGGNVYLSLWEARGSPRPRGYRERPSATSSDS